MPAWARCLRKMGRSREQGISTSGNPRLRKIVFQVARLWLGHQPQSALSLWYNEYNQRDGRAFKPTIIAMARKLLVALTRYAVHGVVIERSVMKPRELQDCETSSWNSRAYVRPYVRLCR
ncbi:protein of unknown function [Bradyrhizobium vignae]|uniref:Transposase n=1 Tax=Bradyrhizobium vignae TaxID=1549949 RepID=A0A2U3QA20_9BRAD|nr:protein of unknown function [Bradyrhizobium vignae]